MLLEHLDQLDPASRVDICIVGSGPAGMTVASELMGSGLRVLLVESGGANEDLARNGLNEIESVGEPRVMDQTKIRNRVLGGSSQTWSGRCAPLEPIDYETRSWVPGSGWPFGAAEIETYTARGAAYLGIAPGAFESRSTRPGLGEVDLELLRPCTWQYSRDRHRPKDYARFARRAQAVSQAPGMTMLLNTTLTQIVTDASGRRVEAIELSDPDGRRKTLKIGTLVLASGGIENARLLLASNRISRAGVGNRHDQVGRNLMDHPRCSAGTFDPRDARRLLDHFGRHFLPASAGGFIQIHGLALSPGLQRAQHLLNASAWLGGEIAADDPIKAGRRFLQRPSLRDARAVAGNVGTLAHSMRTAIGRRREALRKYEQLTLECTAEQAVDPNSRVTLSDCRDMLGVPLARIDWRIGQAERESILTLARLVAREMERLGLPRLRLANWIEAGRLEDASFVDNAHPIGTTRMSADPRSGVVDADAQIHGVEGLYVAGSSVFPTAGHVNPTCMIVALSIRLADRLKVVARRQTSKTVDIAA